MSERPRNKPRVTELQVAAQKLLFKISWCWKKWEPHIRVRQ